MLDVGCGGAHPYTYLKNKLKYYHGVDIEQAIMDVIGCANEKCKLECLSFERTNLDKLLTYDVCYNAFALHHIKDQLGTIDLMVEVLNKDGYLVLAEMHSRPEEHSHHHHGHHDQQHEHTDTHGDSEEQKHKHKHGDNDCHHGQEVFEHLSRQTLIDYCLKHGLTVVESEIELKNIDGENTDAFVIIAKKVN
eukprot:Mrub_09689.p1 GENE.Mrub_09689~~Mrub_09689.p1  ORF type:complete len:223 (+),score=40.27 Mrub_09689:96-671(+)